MIKKEAGGPIIKTYKSSYIFIHENNTYKDHRNILFGLLYPKMKDFLTDKSYHSRPQRIKYNNIGQ